MTVDQLLERDGRIAELEALGDARTADQQDELVALESNRDQVWRKLPGRIHRTRRKVAALEAYARQIGLLLERKRA